MPIMDGPQTIKELKSLNRANKINLDNTKIYGLSAITRDQFLQTDYHKLFDGFCKFNITLIKLFYEYR
jgi:hypothetical protein